MRGLKEAENKRSGGKSSIAAEMEIAPEGSERSYIGTEIAPPTARGSAHKKKILPLTWAAVLAAATVLALLAASGLPASPVPTPEPQQSAATVETQPQPSPTETPSPSPQAPQPELTLEAEPYSYHCFICTAGVEAAGTDLKAAYLEVFDADGAAAGEKSGLSPGAASEMVIEVPDWGDYTVRLTAVTEYMGVEYESLAEKAVTVERMTPFLGQTEALDGRLTVSWYLMDVECTELTFCRPEEVHGSVCDMTVVADGKALPPEAFLQWSVEGMLLTVEIDAEITDIAEITISFADGEKASSVTEKYSPKDPITPLVTEGSAVSGGAELRVTIAQGVTKVEEPTLSIAGEDGTEVERSVTREELDTGIIATGELKPGRYTMTFTARLTMYSGKSGRWQSSVEVNVE